MRNYVFSLYANILTDKEEFVEKIPQCFLTLR